MRAKVEGFFEDDENEIKTKSYDSQCYWWWADEKEDNEDVGGWLWGFDDSVSLMTLVYSPLALHNQCPHIQGSTLGWSHLQNWDDRINHNQIEWG